MTKSPFSPTLPTFQTSWDSTSLGWFKTCPRLYQYQMIEQWSPRTKGIHLAFGGWYASGVERYAHHRANGLSHDEALLAVTRWALEACGRRNAESTFTPWDSQDPIKNRFTLIRSLIWNCEDRETSPLKTVILSNGKPAVELTFNFTAFEVEGEPISLSGHMDELVESEGSTYVKDDKTTKGALNVNYFRQYTPHNQMSLYAIAGKVILNRPVRGVIIRGAQIGVGFTRFSTGQAPRTEAVLREWVENTKSWVSLAHQYAKANFWPMNDTSCDKFGGCSFRAVCSVSPSHRKAWLEEGFEKREWNPLIPRGDDL